MTDKEQPVYWTTQKEICEAINIPRSTLNEVIRRSKKVLIKRRGKGRAAQTGIASVGVLLQCALDTSKEQKMRYRVTLQLFLSESENEQALQHLEHCLKKQHASIKAVERTEKLLNSS